MTISEVCGKFGLTKDTLRYYERIGLVPEIGRTKSGIRDYTEEDCNRIGFIKCMRSAGVQVEALITYMSLFRQGSATAAKRRQILVDERARISERVNEMQKRLKRIEFYRKSPCMHVLQGL
jgi:DNA-binding transcriptional MerR regulator